MERKTTLHIYDRLSPSSRPSPPKDLVCEKGSFARWRKGLVERLPARSQIRIVKITHSRHNAQDMRKHQGKAVVVTPRNALFLLLT
jgi:hypothetical protein